MRQFHAFGLGLALCLVFLGPISAAGGGMRPLGHLSVEQGLSQSTVNCLYQDRRGFLWIGTQDGLNRYDGHRFLVFHTDSRDPSSLSDNYVTRIFEDRRGRIWVGTQSGGLNRLDPTTGRFTRYGSDRNGKPALGSTGILAIADDAEGQLWLGTWGGGLTRLDPATGRIVNYHNDAGNAGSLSNNNVWSVAVDHAGIVWAGTFKGLNRLDPRTGRVSLVDGRAGGGPDLAAINVSSLFEDPAGTLWIGTWGKGLVALAQDRQTFRTFVHDPANPLSLSQDNVWTIVGDADRHIWVGTEKGGLNEFDGQRIVRHLQPSQDAGSPDVAPGVPAVLVDRAGIVWAGTGGTGLYKLLPPLKEFDRHAHSKEDPGSLSGGNVWALFEDRGGFVWVGTIGAGLNRLDPATGRFTRLSASRGGSVAHPAESVYAIIEIPPGDVLVAIDKTGLFRSRGARGTLEPYPDLPATRAVLASLRIMALWADADGAVWIGTLGSGLFRLDAHTGALTRFPVDPKTPGALASNSILTIRRTRDGVLWLGTHGDGLVRYANGAFTSFHTDPANRNTVNDDRIGALYEDASGALWIGTWGGGLNRLSADRQTFSAVTERDGLPNNTIYGIVDDGAGRLWLSTNRGLCRFEPSTGAVRAYSTSDGILDREYNQGAFHRGPSGRIYFGGVNGVTSFLPERIRDNPHEPPVVITSFTRFGQPPGVERPADVGGALTLRHDDSSFSIEFAALDFTAPESNQYRYMLEGLDDGWSQPSTRGYVSFAKVPPGEYTFRVRGSNSDGAWNNAGASLRITITPAPWASRWAYIVYTLVAAGALFLLNDARTRTHRRQIDAQRAELARERQASAALRQAEQALRASEDRFRRFMDNFPGVAFLKDRESRAVYVNRAFERVLGFTNAQIIGKRDDEYFPPDAAAQFRAVDLRVIHEQQTVEFVDEIPFPDGTRYFQTTKFPIPDERGEVALIGGVAIDITDKKLLEQQLVQAQKLESIGTLAGGIAHDFNNLLTIITGYTALLRSDRADQAEAARCMTAIEQAVQRGAALVRQILTFARRSDVSFRPLDLNALIRELAPMLRQTFPKTIAVDLQLHAPLPRVTADHAQIHQVLLNLAVNARDAMPDGGSLTFATSLVAAGQLNSRVPGAGDVPYVRVAVTDTGTGMDGATRTRAFEPFFTTKGPGSGTGLGLAVVYGVLQVHGGFVELDSEPGRGTEFRLYLPAAPEAGDTPAEGTAPAPGRHEGSAVVLVVEDEDLVSDLLKRKLERSGCRVIVARDGEEGVEVYSRRQAEIDLVLMDYGLPKLAGDEAFLKIKAINPAARVVIASGNLDGAVKERLDAAGLCGFLQKPYSLEAVVDMIRQVLARD